DVESAPFAVALGEAVDNIVDETGTVALALPEGVANASPITATESTPVAVNPGAASLWKGRDERAAPERG
ncbi:MAG: hypothetical protein ACRCVX_10545, partial [Shewanella sp.]